MNKNSVLCISKSEKNILKYQLELKSPFCEILKNELILWLLLCYILKILVALLVEPTGKVQSVSEHDDILDFYCFLDWEKMFWKNMHIMLTTSLLVTWKPEVFIMKKENSFPLILIIHRNWKLNAEIGKLRFISLTYTHENLFYHIQCSYWNSLREGCWRMKNTFRI